MSFPSNENDNYILITFPDKFLLFSFQIRGRKKNGKHVFFDDGLFVEVVRKRVLDSHFVSEVYFTPSTTLRVPLIEYFIR
jgi:hypothetical protein